MSQFDSLFKTNNKLKTESKSKQKLTKKKSAASPSSTATTVSAELPLPVKTEKRVGGKSSNTDYTQVLTYIKRDTHRAVKKTLFDDPQNRDLSELVEELLDDWVKKNS